MSCLLALPPDLLEAVVALVPEEGCGLEDDSSVEEDGFSCAGRGFRLWTSARPALEAACRRLRRAALALPPARLVLQLEADQPAANLDMPSLLHGLQRRPPALRVRARIHLMPSAGSSL